MDSVDQNEVVVGFESFLRRGCPVLSRAKLGLRSRIDGGPGARGRAVSTDKALERVVQELLLVMKIILNNAPS